MQDPASPPSVPKSPHPVSPGQGSFHRPASLAQSLDRLAASMGIDQSEIDRCKAFLGLGDRDLQTLTALHDRLKDCPTGFVDTFYRNLLAFEETHALLTDQATIERLKRSQAAYFDQMTAGPYDASYVQNRVRIGALHRQIGLAPKWYLGAYNLYLSELISAVWDLLGTNPQDARDTVTTLVTNFSIQPGHRFVFTKSRLDRLARLGIPSHRDRRGDLCGGPLHSEPCSPRSSRGGPVVTESTHTWRLYWHSF